MIEINQKSENGYTVYTFEANQTNYEILTTDGKEFTVFSSRIGRAGRTAPAVYSNLAELAKRSKALSNFATLINI